MPSPLDAGGVPSVDRDAIEILTGARPRPVDRIITEAARLQVGGRVPPLSRLVELTDAELSLLAKRFGVDPDRVAMTEQAIERATARLIGADNPDPELIERVMRQADAAVRRELQQAAKRLVREYTRSRLDVRADTMMRWVAVDDAANSCPSCARRHGDVKTMARWESEGEPGGADLICGGNCRCDLVAQDMFE